MLENIWDLLSKKDPKYVDEAPSKIKTIEKPKTNKIDLFTIKYLDFFLRFSKSVPQIKDK